MSAGTNGRQPNVAEPSQKLNSVAIEILFVESFDKSYGEFFLPDFFVYGVEQCGCNLPDDLSQLKELLLPSRIVPLLTNLHRLSQVVAPRGPGGLMHKLSPFALRARGLVGC